MPAISPVWETLPCPAGLRFRGEAPLIRVNTAATALTSARRFLQEHPDRCTRCLIVWGETLHRLFATLHKVPAWAPGLVFDFDGRAATTEHGGRLHLLIEPHRVEEQHRRNDLRGLAAYFHLVATHEAGHIAGMGHGHDDAFAVRREDIGIRTLPILPEIEVLLAKHYDADPAAAVRQEVQRAHGRGRGSLRPGAGRR